MAWDSGNSIRPEIQEIAGNSRGGFAGIVVATDRVGG